MFDLIRLKIDGVDALEMEQIIKRNKLQTNSKGNIIYYDNDHTKNIKDGYYIRVSPKGNKIEIECSLHKFWNWKRVHRQVNHNLFTVNDAIKTLKDLSLCTGVDVSRMKVNYYEIGLNLYLDNDCSRYLDIMQTIGVLDNKKELYINPRYKDNTVITTKFYNQIKRVYKVYDKGAEMQDKRQSSPQEDNILRIETIRKRVENTTVKELFTPSNLLKLVDAFLSDWRTLRFDNTLNVPKGTHQWKIDICKNILKNGVEMTLKSIAQMGKSEKQLRLAKKFIREGWNEFKTEIKVVQSPQEQEYREKLYNTIKVVTYRKSMI